MRKYLFLFDSANSVYTHYSKLLMEIKKKEKKKKWSQFLRKQDETPRPQHVLTVALRYFRIYIGRPGLPTFPEHVGSFRPTRKILATKKYSCYRKGVAWHFRPEQSQLIPPVKLPANSWVNVSGSLFWTHYCSLRAAEHHNTRHAAEPRVCEERNVNVALINKRVIGK